MFAMFEFTVAKLVCGLLSVNQPGSQAPDFSSAGTANPLNTTFKMESTEIQQLTSHSLDHPLDQYKGRLPLRLRVRPELMWLPLPTEKLCLSEKAPKGDTEA